MFVDHIRVYARAGAGGDGHAGFRRESFVPRGGPDGGDGGRGGDVILRADVHTDSLVAFFYDPKIIAQDGERGRGKKMFGKAGLPKIVPVPVGTRVYRLPAGVTLSGRPSIDAGFDEDQAPGDDEQASPGEPVALADLECIADLTTADQQFVLCQGGRGGRGNVHFKSSRNQAPTRADPGEPGGEGNFYLELRTIADVGLVGYPNAGKSTLLGKISAAHPKVAPYPFTTLHPVVGIVEFDGYRRATVADIPGLIEGAHRNIGLGHEFLRHIVRCKLLLFVLDMAGSEGRNPLEDYASLRCELALHDPALVERSALVVANKMDAAAAEENLRLFRKRHPKMETLAVSAEQSLGLDELRRALAKHIFTDSAEPVTT